MERLIGALLEDFERGKLSRRQLVRSLAGAITAAVAGVGASPSASAQNPPGKGFKAVSVHHISYRVKDYGKTRDFYSDLLGMPVRGDTGKQCSLIFGDSVLIVRGGGADGRTPLVDHIAYTIDAWRKDDIDAELKRRGLSPTIDPENSFHVKDPDGYHVQLNMVSAH